MQSSVKKVFRLSADDPLFRGAVLCFLMIGFLYAFGCDPINPLAPPDSPENNDENTSPKANFIYAVDGLSVTVDASGSSDSEDAAKDLVVRWDFGADDGWTAWSTTKTKSYTYGSGGTYTIKLQVKDTDRKWVTKRKSVTVEQDNTAPTASFTRAVDGLTVNVDASGSSDSEDHIDNLQVRWNFGDGSGWTTWSATKTKSHTYGSADTYTITLEVKDTEGLTDEASKQVTVEGGSSGTVPPTGGSVEYEGPDGDVIVEFPSGTLDSDATVTIASQTPSVALPTGLALVGDHSYEITCSASDMEGYAGISLPIPGEVDPGLSYLGLWLDGTEWKQVEGVLDKSSQVFVIHTQHFSEYAVASVERAPESDGCSGQGHCDDTAVVFEFDNPNASVFSVSCSLENTDLVSVLGTEGCSAALSLALGAFNPITSIVSVASALIDERHDPVRVAALTTEVEISGGQAEASAPLDENALSGVVYLDFIGARVSDFKVSRYRELTLAVQHVGLFDAPYGFVDGLKTLLSQDEMRGLDPCKSYIIIPKSPFDVSSVEPGGYPDDPRDREVYLNARATWDAIPPFVGTDDQRVKVNLDAADLPPTAAFTVSKNNLTVNVDASDSWDNEDSTADLQVRWNFHDYSGWTSWSTTKTKSHTYGSADTYTITLEVKDTGGLTDDATKDVTVTDGGGGDEITIDCGGGVEMVLVKIPAGSFEMGTAFTDYSWLSRSRPVHEVNIGYDFYMGKYEVTQAQYQAVMGTNPSYFKGDVKRPVEEVSWNDAVAFCEALSTISGYNIRLPSESEWEYACKAGSGDTKFHFGNDNSDLGDYAWYFSNSSSTTHPVGEKSPNDFGLHDMHGNVWEWCQDWWHDTYTGAPTDGSAWETPSGSYRVLRGGSWGSLAGSCRSAFRDRRAPSITGSNDGFRVVSGTD